MKDGLQLEKDLQREENILSGMSPLSKKYQPQNKRVKRIRADLDEWESKFNARKNKDPDNQ